MSFRLARLSSSFQISCHAIEYTITLKLNSTKLVKNTYNVTGLPQDSTQYTCHIYGCNSLGCSNSSKPLKVFTTPSGKLKFTNIYGLHCLVISFVLHHVAKTCSVFISYRPCCIYSLQLLLIGRRSY